MNRQIREVWADNLIEEITNISEVIQKFPVVAMVCFKH